MKRARKLDLALVWHMHQPDYRDPDSGEFVLPWVYLHATKDYTDMAAHLERHPRIRAVVNFVPILLDQIEDYAGQIASGRLRDPLLGLLAQPAQAALSREQRAHAIDACFRANHDRMVEPYAHYHRLYELFRAAETPDGVGLDYLSDAYFADLTTWYHLAWTGETERRSRPALRQLMQQDKAYSAGDQQRLLAELGDMLARIIPRYRALASSGQIELSTTPYAHPLAPLLFDFGSARETVPEASLPVAAGYPGGAARFAAHLDAALAGHAARFGAPRPGVWPAEGAVSAAMLPLLAARSCAWTASGEAVLANTLDRAGRPYARTRDLYRPWRDASGLAVYFRDDRLSDLIGFEYAKWHGADAARHFIGELERIAEEAPPDEVPLVSVILDGENAWEYFPYNAFYFFEELYAMLETHPTIRTVTLGEAATDPVQLARTTPLPPVCAGSWVYGTLSTWIGEPDKNRAWDLLCTAKEAYDAVVGSGQLDGRAAAEATARLRVCESSDWFWWFGDYNPAPAVASFDRLFRHNLAALYRSLRLPAPMALDVPLSRGGGHPETGGTMRRSSAGA